MIGLCTVEPKFVQTPSDIKVAFWITQLPDEKEALMSEGMGWAGLTDAPEEEPDSTGPEQLPTNKGCSRPRVKSLHGRLTPGHTQCTEESGRRRDTRMGLQESGLQKVNLGRVLGLGKNEGPVVVVDTAGASSVQTLAWGDA